MESIRTWLFLFALVCSAVIKRTAIARLRRADKLANCTETAP